MLYMFNSKKSSIIFLSYIFSLAFIISSLGCGEVEQIDEIKLKDVIDFVDEASNAGYEIPQMSIRGVNNFYVEASAEAIIDTSSHTSGTTTSGAAEYSISTSSLLSSDVNIKLWINGEIFDANYDSSNNRAEGVIVLNSGINYISTIIYYEGIEWGRSYVVKITSSIDQSLLRFELSWDNDGDLDIHLDDGTMNKHVYYGKTIYNQSGFNIELDIDDLNDYGPENIRVYECPSGSNFRCFVNYYSASDYYTITATVRIFQGTDLYNTYTHQFNHSEANGKSGYNTDSWVVGIFTYYD